VRARLGTVGKPQSSQVEVFLCCANQ
jgi:hypothetical protein